VTCNTLTLLVGVFLIAGGCSSREAAQPPAAAAKPGGQTPSPECVRGEPEALLVSHSDFQKSSPQEAVETVQTGSPIKLVIHHFGCTHYALDFEFTWAEPRMPEPKVSLVEAAAVLEKLPIKDSYGPLMKSLAEAIRKMAKDPYKQPLTMSEMETLTATTPALNVLRVRYNVAL
jgi:hypothetical protein